MLFLGLEKLFVSLSIVASTNNLASVGVHRTGIHCQHLHVSVLEHLQ